MNKVGDLEQIAEIEREPASDGESDTWNSDKVKQQGIVAEVEELEIKVFR